MKKAFLLLFSFFSIFSFAQTINDYEYVAIKKKYDFQRSPDEYQLNTLLKCQLVEYGFRVLYASDLPLVSEVDRCLILNANVISKSNIFLFKFIIEFTDCNNAVVYQSEIGGSKEKDLHDAFTEALDGALKSVKLAKYEFQGVSKDIILNGEQPFQIAQSTKANKVELVTAENNDDKAKLENSWMEEAAGSKIASSQKAVVQNTTPVKKNAGTKKKVVAKSKSKNVLANRNKKPLQPAVAKVGEKSTDNQSKVEEKTVVSEIAVVELKKEIPFSEMLLYAQAIEKGFQLVDTTPKVILKIYNTLQPGYYNANIDNKFGAVFIKNNQWVFEYFMEGKLVTESLNIKFCN